MNAFVSIVILALEIYGFILLARVLLSWFPEVDRSNPIVQFLYDITEPLLVPIREMLRQFMPQSGGMMMDFSPLILFLLIRVIIVLLASF